MTYDAADVRAAQEHFGFLRPEPIEKDWHVVRALVSISGVNSKPFGLVFAGGTALARAHRLVRRMSEDVDLKVVLTGERPSSANQFRRSLGNLREAVTTALHSAGFDFDPHDENRHRARDANRYLVYHLPYENMAAVEHGLRPVIQIELTYTTLRQAPVALPVSSFLAEAFRHDPELPAVACASVTETAAEKFVGLTRRIAMELAGISRNRDPTLVRHIYDLHLIRETVDLDTAATLARAIAVADANEFRNQFPLYHSDVTGETRKALAAVKSEPFFRQSYVSFVNSMVYGERPGFEEAFGTVRDLAARFLAEQLTG